MSHPAPDAEPLAVAQAFAAAWEGGMVLSLERAIAYALSDEA